MLIDNFWPIRHSHASSTNSLLIPSLLSAPNGMTVKELSVLMVTGQNGSGQNITDKMARTKWKQFLL